MGIGQTREREGGASGGFCSVNGFRESVWSGSGTRCVYLDVCLKMELITRSGLAPVVSVSPIDSLPHTSQHHLPLRALQNHIPHCSHTHTLPLGPLSRQPAHCVYGDRYAEKNLIENGQLDGLKHRPHSHFFKFYIKPQKFAILSPNIAVFMAKNWQWKNILLK